MSGIQRKSGMSMAVKTSLCGPGGNQRAKRRPRTEKQASCQERERKTCPGKSLPGGFGHGPCATGCTPVTADAHTVADGTDRPGCRREIGFSEPAHFCQCGLPSRSTSPPEPQHSDRSGTASGTASSPRRSLDRMQCGIGRMFDWRRGSSLLLPDGTRDALRGLPARIRCFHQRLEIGPMWGSISPVPGPQHHLLVRHLLLLGMTQDRTTASAPRRASCIRTAQRVSG